MVWKHTKAFPTSGSPKLEKAGVEAQNLEIGKHFSIVLTFIATTLLDVELLLSTQKL